jgi:hypothetical protein
MKIAGLLFFAEGLYALEVIYAGIFGDLPPKGHNGSLSTLVEVRECLSRSKGKRYLDIMDFKEYSQDRRYRRPLNIEGATSPADIMKDLERVDDDVILLVPQAQMSKEKVECRCEDKYCRIVLRTYTGWIMNNLDFLNCVVAGKNPDTRKCINNSYKQAQEVGYSPVEEGFQQHQSRSRRYTMGMESSR